MKLQGTVDSCDIDYRDMHQFAFEVVYKDTVELYYYCNCFKQ